MVNVSPASHAHSPVDSAGRRTPVAELSHEFRLANGRLARRVRQEKAPSDLSDGQFAALGTLYTHGPLTLGELSEREHVTPPSMNRTVNALVDAGLVHRAGSTDDGRKVQLTASEAGVALVLETRKRRDAWLTRRVLQLSPEERAVLAEATVIMRGLVDC